ncbi:hypothetical protein HB779_13460 [Phyllobacterium sp. 628]|uniref:hypothetical protein n=1 Tax=Phyllobacterium sp. 628 TaxID=2718938 RepID=UPI0016624458|nr:hypothetical protein [Phyllobacterium sp. 628]QND52800.1 hypothetical protein HB779_13460 [Phyllobacterium sp. 628]
MALRAEGQDLLIMFCFVSVAGLKSGDRIQGYIDSLSGGAAGSPWHVRMQTAKQHRAPDQIGQGRSKRYSDGRAE